MILQNDVILVMNVAIDLQPFLYLGIQYSIGRVTMAGTDYSTREYTYADVAEDFELRHFALTPEDFQFKVEHQIVQSIHYHAINKQPRHKCGDRS